MFTGIVTDIGKVISFEDSRLTLHSNFDPITIVIGSSIACDGVCLSVTSIYSEQGKALLSFDVSPETKLRTTLGSWYSGRLINLERSVKVGDDLSGHIVSGHVDGTAQIVCREVEGDNIRFTLKAQAEHERFLASKGSIALDGTSLTVNQVDGLSFGVNLIPHTLASTTWSVKKKGDHVNLEIDMIARYIDRILKYRHGKT